MTECALYRHFDASGALLYVGVCLDVVDRLGKHKHRSEWFTEIRTITIEWYPSKAEAEAAEDRAITEERPRYNMAGNRPKVLGDDGLFSPLSTANGNWKSGEKQSVKDRWVFEIAADSRRENLLRVNDASLQRRGIPSYKQFVSMMAGRLDGKEVA